MTSDEPAYRQLARTAGHHAAVARLPEAALGVPELDADPAWRLAAAFLVGFRGHTRRAYFNDIRAWYAWCESVGVHPLATRRHHVDRWIAEQTEAAQPRTGKPAAAATVARRMSCLSGLYFRRSYLHKAKMSGACLVGAFLNGADLTGADLTGADLKDAQLTRGSLSPEQLRGVRNGNKIIWVSREPRMQNGPPTSQRPRIMGCRHRNVRKSTPIAPLLCTY